MSDMRKATTTKWEICNHIATYVLAIVAILGFMYSINSSRQTSNTLRTVQTGVESLIEPIVKFKGYNWVKDGDKDLSCENPPKGILVSYANVSNVPVIIHSTSFRPFFGATEFEELQNDARIMARKSGPDILTPGDEMRSGTIHKEHFQEWLGTPKDDEFVPPHFNFILELEYSRLGSEKRYLYSTHREVYFTCTQAGSRMNTALHETIKIVE